MIKNEREFKISKAQAAKFRKALESFVRAAHVDERERLALELQRDAMQSQLQELDEELAEYEELVSSPPAVITADSLEALPIALIKARIASGLSHRQLADMIGIKEQQIQRYEATDYEGANLRRLAEVAKALGIVIRPQLLLGESSSVPALLKRLTSAGLPKDFVWERLLPSLELYVEAADRNELSTRFSNRLQRIFNWDAADLTTAFTPTFPQTSAVSARFKKPRRGSSEGITHQAVSAYAHHIARLALTAAKRTDARPLPADPRDLYRELSDRFGKIDFDNTVRFVWDCGIPVIPLRIRGGFHAAVWRFDGRNAIVLTQQTHHASRWLIDLLHEAYHTTEEPSSDTFSRVDIDDPISVKSIDENERRATRYALIAALGPSLEVMLHECAAVAAGSVERLKSCVPIVAGRHNVHAGVLANALAYRLAHQTPAVSWWPTATALQENGEPFSTARLLLLANVDKAKLAEDDWALLQQALED